MSQFLERSRQKLKVGGGERETDSFEDKVVQVNRVSKKIAGGNKIGFSILVVSGNRAGRVGVGLGKARDVASAVKKGARRARKNMIDVPVTKNGSIPFDVNVKTGAAEVMLKPAPEGSGIIAGGPVRAVVALAGIRNISSKILGTNNKASNVYATIEALKRLGLRKVSEVKSQKAKGKNEG